MRMFLFLVILVMAVAVTGYVRGWYTFTSTPSADHQTTRVNITVDNVKWQSDKKVFLEKARSTIQVLEQKLAGLQAKAQDAPPQNQPAIQQQIDALQAHKQNAQEQLNQLENAKPDTWDGVKGQFERSFSKFWQ